jgi:Uma2 family endonuclease
MQATRYDQPHNTRPITVAEYHRMGKLGIIGPDERVELLDGELITMPPMSPEHASTVRALTTFFYRTVAGRASISPQCVIALDPISEPQPDVMLAMPPDQRYEEAHPTPNDALLVVEVSKSTLSFDRGKKLAAYARCRVREYWIVDLVHERIEIYRDPQKEGYARHERVTRGETLAPAAFPDAVIAADEILPSPARPARRRR